MGRQISAVALLLILATPASALECIEIPLETSMKRAEIVLLGRIEAVRYHMVSENSASHLIVTVSVKRLWKGATSSTIELHQPFIGGGIAFSEEIGKDYVLFVRTFTPERPLLPDIVMAAKSGFVATECISKPVAKYDLKTLGRGRTPMK